MMPGESSARRRYRLLCMWTKRCTPP
jgi:hypothetical protein